MIIEIETFCRLCGNTGKKLVREQVSDVYVASLQEQFICSYCLRENGLTKEDRPNISDHSAPDCVHCGSEHLSRLCQSK